MCCLDLPAFRASAGLAALGRWDEALHDATRAEASLATCAVAAEALARAGRWDAALERLAAAQPAPATHDCIAKWNT